MSIVPIKESLPVPARASIVSFFFLRASEELALEDNAGLDEENLAAKLHFYALRESEKGRQVCEEAQAHIVANIVRGRMWLAFPSSEAYEGGFSSPEEMVSAALEEAIGVQGKVPPQRRYLLRSVGRIVAFCDDADIPVDQQLGQYAKFRAAVAALNRAVEQGDVDQVRAILEDVNTAASRDDIRAKYHAKSLPPAGRGTFIKLRDGRIVFVAVVNYESERKRVVEKLSGVLEWGLAAGGGVEEGGIRVFITEEG